MAVLPKQFLAADYVVEGGWVLLQPFVQVLASANEGQSIVYEVHSAEVVDAVAEI